MKLNAILKVEYNKKYLIYIKKTDQVIVEFKITDPFQAFHQNQNTFIEGIKHRNWLGEHIAYLWDTLNLLQLQLHQGN